MVLYCVIPKLEASAEEEILKIFPDQREAYNYKKDKDPDGEKNLTIYPVEI